MNPMLYTFLAIAVLASPAIAIFDGGLTAVLGTAGLSLAAGTGGALFITNAGLVAGAVGLLGAAIVKGSLAGRGFRGKREAKEGEEDTQTLLALQLVDSYFMTILDMDIDDCGKRLVCEIPTVPEAERSVEENLISGLFDGSTTIDPLSAKSEYDLAAFIGVNYNKETCAKRYHRCKLDRKTIVQALGKIGA